MNHSQFRLTRHASLAVSIIAALALAGCGGGGGSPGTTTVSQQLQQQNAAPATTTAGTSPSTSAPTTSTPVTSTPVTSTPTTVAPAAPVTAPTTTTPVTTAPVVTAPVVTAPVVTTPVVSPPIVTAPVVTTPAVSDLAPACTGCGATSNTAYSGSGVGVWTKKNTGTAPVDMQIDIGNLSSKDVMLVFSNETSADIGMASTIHSSMMAAPASLLTAPARMSRYLASATNSAQPIDRDGVKEFNRAGFKAHLGAPKARTASAYKLSSSVAPLLSVLGDTRSFNHHDGSSRLTTLKKQLQMSDGTMLNVWVENTEISESKVSTAIIAELATTFGRTGGVYDMLKDAGGPLWGPNNFNELVPGGQPIDIVILNFVPDGAPFGELGYFYSMNNFKKTAAPLSNESVSLYLDAETLYLGGTKGMQAIKSVLAHEGQHMGNFYRRNILMGSTYAYDTWLEEMTALMMEDAASSGIDPTYNPTRDMRAPQYLSSASYNCALLNFTGSDSACESYSVTGTFGGFLLRQMGMAFFKNLLTQNVTDSEGALQAAIKLVRPQSSVGEELRKFAVASIPAMPAASAPAGFNFPARTDGAYIIPAIDMSADKIGRVLPGVAPSILRAYANYPVLRQAVSGRYQETVRVPAGATLSVIIN